MEKRIYRVGGRDSRLEQSRSRELMAILQARCEDFQSLTVPISALDDTDLLLPKTLGAAARKKAELDLLLRSLAREQIDLVAVHATDLPTSLQDGLTIGAVPKRGDVRDVLVLEKGRSFATLDAGSLLMTTGQRRVLQLAALRSDLSVETTARSLEDQLAMLQAGEAVGAVASATDLLALGMDEYRERLSFRPFAVTAMVPAPGQAQMLILCRQTDQELQDLLATHLDDPQARACFAAEQQIAQALGLIGSGVDRLPAAVYVHTEASEVSEASETSGATATWNLYLLALHRDKESGQGKIIRQRLNRGGEAVAEAALIDVALRSILGRLSYIGADLYNPDLLTKAASERISEATVVFYDDALAEVTKRLAENSQAKFYPIQAGEAVVEQIMEMLRRGEDCVRMVAGDPFLYGSASGELLRLHGAGVTYDLVPGISSLVSWPLYAGIPLIHPEMARHLHIYDGRVFPLREGAALADELASLSDSSTLLFYQAALRLPDIVRALLQVGMAEDKPASLIASGTSLSPKLVSGTIGELASEAVAANIADPAILVVGEVNKLREKLAWWPPLGSMTDMRFMELSTGGADGEKKRLAGKLRAQGAKVHSVSLATEAPASHLTEAIELAIVDALEHKQSARRFERSELWFALCGVGAVGAFSDAIRQLGLDHRLLAGVKFAVCDRPTADALSRLGFEADYLPPSEDQDEMAAHLADLLSPSDFVLSIGVKTALHVMQVVLQLAEIPSVGLEYATYTPASFDSIRFLDQLAEVDNLIFHDAAAVREFAERLTSLGMDLAELAESGLLLFASTNEAAVACRRRSLPLADEPSNYTEDLVIDGLKAKAIRRTEDEGGR